MKCNSIRSFKKNTPPIQENSQYTQARLLNIPKIAPAKISLCCYTEESNIFLPCQPHSWAEWESTTHNSLGGPRILQDPLWDHPGPRSTQQGPWEEMWFPSQGSAQVNGEGPSTETGSHPSLDGIPCRYLREVGRKEGRGKTEGRRKPTLPLILRPGSQPTYVPLTHTWLGSRELQEAPSRTGMGSLPWTLTLIQKVTWR